MAAVSLLLLVLATGWPAGAAKADGDPASDVLATQTLFLPQDAGVAVRQQLELQQLLQEARRSGYPLRLALIASATDLGSVSELWGQPASYAKFLGQELSLTYRGMLLVIMPAGFGVYHRGVSTAPAQAGLSTVPAPGARAGLGATAIDAVRRMAAVAGHPLRVPTADTAGPSGHGDPLPWIVFALGLAAIGAAWVASLRARPFRLGKHDVPVS